MSYGLSPAWSPAFAGELLLVLTTRLGHAFQRHRRGLLRALAAQVTEADDPDQPVVLVHNGQAPHLLAAHALGNVGRVVVLARADDVRAHQFADRRVRATALGNSA